MATEEVAQERPAESARWERWERASAPVRRAAERFPWERALLLGVAAVVGIYAGIAAGLFSQSIRFAQIVVFGGGAASGGGARPAWSQLFLQSVRTAHWHLEFAVVAALMLLFAAALRWLGEKRRVRVPMFEVRRVRAVAQAGAFGLALYYPLVLLRAFNGTFPEAEGGLYGMLERASWLRILLAPAVGALLAGLLVRYVSPESGGHGVVEVIEAVNVRARQIRGRVAVWKALAAGLVIGSGGSAGREGPVVHIGGAVAAALSRSLSLPRKQLVLLLACGAGAAIAASFQAPFAGTLFALEIVLVGFEARQIAPVVLACVTATVTSRALIGGGAELRSVPWALTHPSEIAVYLVLGVGAGLCGLVYVRALRSAEELFAGHLGGALSRALSRLPLPLRAAAGGLCVGALGLVAPRSLGVGVETMNAALAGELSLSVLLLALAVKLLSTASTLGSGAPGGSFFPAVFLGAMLGGAFGHVVQAFAPGLASAPASYAAVGMGAVVAGATVAPLTGVMMMIELTGSYQIAVPLLLACCVSAALVQGVLGGSLYSLGARRRGVRLRRSGVSLGELSVAQAMERRPRPPADALSYEGAAALPRFYEDDDLETALHGLAAADAPEAVVLGVAGADEDLATGVITRKAILETLRDASLAER